MRSYLKYFKLRFITKLQYRSAALAGIATQLFFGFVYIYLYFAIYKSNTNGTYPMEWSQLATYLWLQQVFFALIYTFEKDDELLKMIKNGDIAYELVRPQNFFLKFYIKMIANKTSATLMRCIPIIIIALLLPKPINLALPASVPNFILFLLSLITATFLVSAFCILIHIISMFTMDSKGVISIYGVIVEVLSGATIPIVFFPKWLKAISDLLPFKFICDFPFRVYSNNIVISDGITYLFQSIIWLFIVILICMILTKIALKKAVIQGG